MAEKIKKENLPFFSGKAIEVRFPDMVFVDEHGKKVKKQIKFITYPDWIHDIYIMDIVYKVLGEDLQIGMPLSMGGALFPIIDINEHYYHGIIKTEEHPIGYMGDTTNLKKYTFKRIIKKGVDYWVVEEVKNIFSSSSFSKEDLVSFEKDQLIKHYLKLQDSFQKISLELTNLKENLKTC